MSSPQPPDIPGYRILSVLGKGGMATVYLAVQESLGREVALKLLAPALAQDAGAAERFMREARTAARLVHRHIVGIHEVGTHEGQPYLAMEYLPGDTVPSQQLPPSLALQITREIALALDHAHKQGVIHRDIKPENILRRADGSSALADFGIARTTDAGSAMTQDGVTLGTPNYMSPEQLQGKPLDGRADLYSLGVVLFQLLSGHLPYQGTDGWSVGVQHISAPLPKLPDALGRYQGLVDRLMAKDPDLRPQTGADAAQLLEQALNGITPAATVSLATQPPARKTRLLAAASAAGLLAVLSTLWWFGLRDKSGDVAVTAVADRSIAVLPLANLSRNPDNEYFSDGLAETTLDMLARVPDLRVIARSSSFAFKGKTVDVREIGKTLGAANLLQGSVQRDGDRVRITMQLVRSSDGANLWSQKYDRQLADVFRIQDEVATEVVTALSGALLQDDRQRLLARRTENLDAYQEYLKGNALLPLRKVDDLRLALTHFQRALEIDPDYAQAHVGAANTLLLLKTHASLSPEQSVELDRHIQRAIALDPRSGEAQVALAGSLQASDRAAAERAFKRGLELSPNYATGLQWYAEYLSHDLGQPERAVPLLQRAIDLDPLAPIIQVELARTYLKLGQGDKAQLTSDEVVSRFPDFALGYVLRGDLMRDRQDLVGYLDAVRKSLVVDPSSSRSRAERCTAILHAGAFSDARRCAQALQDSPDLEKWRRDFEADFAYFTQGFEAYRTALGSLDKLEPWQQALVLRQSGQLDQALAKYRAFEPELLAQPLGQPALASPYDATDVGILLMALGRREQAETVIRYGMAATANRPRAGEAGRSWSVVYGRSALGDFQGACAELRSAAEEGFWESYPALQRDEDLAGLRQQPCFAPAFARIKAIADQQVERARKAGLL